MGQVPVGDIIDGRLGGMWHLKNMPCL